MLLLATCLAPAAPPLSKRIATVEPGSFDVRGRALEKAVDDLLAEMK